MAESTPTPPSSWLQTLWSQTWFRRVALFVVLLFVVSGVMWMRPSPAAEVVQAQRRKVVELVIATGKLRSYEQTALSAEISGVVEKLLVNEGDRVKKGQKLARLNNSTLYYQMRQSRSAVRVAKSQLKRVSRKPLPAEIDGAKANLRLARSRTRQAYRAYLRALQLYRSKTLAREGLDTRKSTWEQARAQEKAQAASLARLKNMPRSEDILVAQAQLQQARNAYNLTLSQANKRWIVAPYDGVIVSRKVSVGQNTTPQTPLFVIADDKKLEIYAETDENNISRLETGQKALIVATAFKRAPFEAVLKTISPLIDSKRGVVGLRLRPLSLPKRALLNMTVDINIRVATWKHALSLPRTTLHTDGVAPSVLILKDGVATRTAVSLLGSNANWLVLKSFPEKARVIRFGRRYKTGQSLRIKRRPRWLKRLKKRR